jgi:toxin-antitoxin system PIN domain toxin
MSTFLLDVNVLLALSDPMHAHHEAAHRWFADSGHLSWATCPLTENGFVRIASHPSYPNRPGDVGIVLAHLRQFCAAAGHQFWSEDVSIRDLLVPDVVVTHAHVTDVYLLGLAVQRG